MRSIRYIVYSFFDLSSFQSQNVSKYRDRDFGRGLHPNRGHGHDHDHDNVHSYGHDHRHNRDKKLSRLEEIKLLGTRGNACFRDTDIFIRNDTRDES